MLALKMAHPSFQQIQASFEVHVHIHIPFERISLFNNRLVLDSNDMIHGGYWVLFRAQGEAEVDGGDGGDGEEGGGETTATTAWMGG